MYGFNKDFMDNPLAFLQKIAIVVKADIAPVPDKDGVAVFDLLPFGPTSAIPGGLDKFDQAKNKAKIKSVTLDVWRDHAKTTSQGTQHPIRAYWLPYRDGATLPRKLGNKALYCFTVGLSGCYIGIEAGNDPTIAHVAGDIRGASEPENLKRAAEAVIGKPVARHFDSNAVDAPYITMVGVRASTGAWAFHFQGNQGTMSDSKLAALDRAGVFDNPRAKNVETR